MLCNSCHSEKDVDNFYFKNRQRNIRKKICKQCHAQYRKQHYLQNREKYIIKAKKWNLTQREILRKYIFAVLSNSQCIDCGEKDIVVLDFDHLENKKLGLAEMYKNRYSLQAIEDEIKKCEVRCANCHRRKTANETGFWKTKLI